MTMSSRSRRYPRPIASAWTSIRIASIGVSRRILTPSEPERVAAAYERLSARCEAVVVEGTGGWFAPIGECGTMADIAQRLELPVVLTVGLRLGCLSHALLSVQAIGVSNLKLAGWIGSVLAPDMPALQENLATLDAML